jgi:hypothetical protein
MTESHSRTHGQSSATESRQLPHGKRLLLGVEGTDTQEAVLELLGSLLELLDASGRRVATVEPVEAGQLYAPGILGDHPFTIVVVTVTAV